MAQLVSVRDLYQVETEADDWPKGLPEAEKEVLQKAVLDVLDKYGARGTYDLYQCVKNHPLIVEGVPTFRKVALLDWRYACIVRAARAVDAEQR